MMDTGSILAAGRTEGIGMKKLIFFVVLLGLGIRVCSFAQEKTTETKAVQKKPHAEADRQRSATEDANNKTTTLTSTSSDQAYGSSRFSIADPTIISLNDRANGNNVPVSSSGIVGMPKRVYGFANGKILLRNTTALSSGTTYGSGAVGTGTTITGIGTGENVIGVNGKAPYAGPSLWGSHLPLQRTPPAPATTTTPSSTPIRSSTTNQ